LGLSDHEACDGTATRECSCCRPGGPTVDAANVLRCGKVAAAPHAAIAIANHDPAHFEALCFARANALRLVRELTASLLSVMMDRAQPTAAPALVDVSTFERGFGVQATLPGWCVPLRVGCGVSTGSELQRIALHFL
jgi:hypothetical protein